MAVGLSNGQSFPDEGEFWGSIASTRPLGSPEKPADALKSQEGSQTPGNSQKVESMPDFTNQYGTPDKYKIWPERLVDSAISAVTLPGDALAGKVDPMSEEGLHRSFDLASLMVGGPAPVASKLADGTLGSFAGVKAISNLKGSAKNEALSNLGHAQVLEAAGEHPDVIWKQTGFGRGADGRWRHEIDDSKAVLDTNWSTTNPDDVGEVFKNAGIAMDTLYGQGGKNNTYGLRKWKTDEKIDPNTLNPELKSWWDRLHTNEVPIQRLGDILDHPDLYTMYPHTRNIQVQMDSKMNPSSASWNNSNTIKVGSEAAKNTGTIMHEVQHAIQDFEGFAKGGAPGIQGETYRLKLADAAKKQIQEPLEALIHKRDEGPGWTDKDIIEAARLRGLAQKYMEYSNAGKEEAFRNYERLAGEAEARNTDIRLLMSKLERRDISPRWTMDVDPKELILRDRPQYTDPYMK